MSANAGLYVEVALFSLPQLGLLMWTLSALKSRSEDHERRLNWAEPKLNDVRERVSKLEGKEATA